MNISNVFFLLRSILIDAATTQFTREFRGINLLGQNNSLDLFIAFLSLSLYKTFPQPFISYKASHECLFIDLVPRWHQKYKWIGSELKKSILVDDIEEYFSPSSSPNIARSFSKLGPRHCQGELKDIF